MRLNDAAVTTNQKKSQWLTTTILFLPHFMIILAVIWKQVHSLHSGIQGEEAAFIWDVAVFVVEEKGDGGAM